MSDAVFPTLKGLGFPVLKRAVFSTEEQIPGSGKKKEIVNWVYPRWEYELTYNYLRDAPTYNELKTLLGFFLTRRGKADSFLFDDPDDDFISGQQLGVGDGQTKDFQLVRSFGGFIEPCLNIKASPVPKIYLDEVLQEAGYTLDYTDSGVVSFTTAPLLDKVVSADFGYYWRLKFTEDYAEFQKNLSQVWDNKQTTIKLETKK